jgi:capsular polysaccharide biosynthesis protein
LTSVLFGTVAYFVSLQITPVYQGSTTLLISPAPTIGTFSDANALRTSTDLAKTYTLLLQSRPILDETIANLKLSTDPQTLSKQIDIQPIRDTQLMVLTVDDNNPQRAADIANEMVRVFSLENRRLQAYHYEVVVVETAQPSRFPVVPNVWLYTFLAAIVGAMLVVGRMIIVVQLKSPAEPEKPSAEAAVPASPVAMGSVIAEAVAAAYAQFAEARER